MTATLDEETEVQGNDPAPSRHRRRVLTVRRWVILLAIGLGMALGAWNVWVTWQSKQELGIIAGLQRSANKSQNNHHAATVKTDAQLKSALHDLALSAAAIQYEGGVIAYQGGELNQKDDEIIAAQQQGHALLMAVATLQTEINQDVPALKFGLNLGQMQINNSLRYDICIGTNPTNTAVCGAEPPLPATS